MNLCKCLTGYAERILDNLKLEMRTVHLKTGLGDSDFEAENTRKLVHEIGMVEDECNIKVGTAKELTLEVADLIGKKNFDLALKKISQARREMRYECKEVLKPVER